uniref:F-box/FBD/LRR-repeat protein At1g13570-like isoform X2 n=1 Tax=Erigeron canadensis TaxID=72917 RepID=UPI001CB8CDE1|nr:F-box/FBD/LRR-repeat protein At1g13570-like isoform X2 [Erigeron canadensis]
MELVHGRSGKSSKSVPLEDVIGSMPENVITNIIDRLPLQEAIRTGILSRNWRYKWTLLSQLVFDYDFFLFLKGSGDDIMHFDGKNISRLLLHLKGAITNFVLDIPEFIKLDVEDVNHWIVFLCRIGIKKFTLIHEYDELKLPAHIFSCLELKHLELGSCISGPLPCFRGFPNLLSLQLDQVRIQDCKCGNLIVQSPLLEILSITDFVARSEVNLAEIVKLENLKELNLSLCLLDNMTMTRPSNIFHQMSLLPRLQSLSLNFRKCKFLAEAGTQRWVSTAFPCLKTLKLNQIDFSSDTMLSCVVAMLSGAPNLQTLEIMAAYENTIPPPLICSLEGDCSNFGLLQLQYVVLNIRALDNEFRLASKLLMLHRASPVAEIMLL